MDLVMKMRMEIVEEGRSWVGTPYLYGAKQKGRGVDCSEFVIDPWRVKRIIDPRTTLPRQHRDWIMDKTPPNPHIFRDFILKFCYVIPFDDRLPADMITFMFNGLESHIAIVDSLDPDYILHAVSCQRVRRQRLASLNSMVAVYRPKAFRSSESVCKALTSNGSEWPQDQRNGSGEGNTGSEQGKMGEFSKK